MNSEERSNWLKRRTACDHTVMMVCGFDDLVTQSRVVSMVRKAAYHRVDSNGKPITLVDFLNWRSGLSMLFTFCPECGYKIDWDEIKANQFRVKK